ncbi:MAG: hypothetical protein RLZZ433_1147 [Pseudomonadota bacterium]|jgi:hypothetical protein
MIDIETPHYALGVVAISLAVFYAAWYEFRRKNKRDAKLLATAGAMSIAGTAFVLLAMNP